MLVCDQERLNFATEALTALRIPALVCRAVAKATTPGVNAVIHHYADVIRRNNGSEMPPYPKHLTTDDTAAIFYTSGSTGNPKGVCQTHRGICNQLHSLLAQAALAPPPPPTSKRLKRQEALVCAVPLFHVTGSHHIFLTSLIMGARLVLMYKWDVR
jgi:acyl-CoA synthetase (AMP-forming)/AMP-acid ligase II